MTLTVIVAIWGAVVSTAVAITQFIAFRNSRPRLFVKLSSAQLPGLDGPLARFGSRTQRQGPDKIDVLVVPILTVTNRGDKAVQLVSVTLESIAKEGGPLNVQEIVPEEFPTVLEPRTSIEVPVQIEYIDMTDAVTFMGITDALGNRHAVQDEELIRQVRYFWGLPSEVKWYQRKDDPSVKVLAFQTRQNGRMSTAEVKSTRRLRPIVERPKRHPSVQFSSPDTGNDKLEEAKEELEE